MKRIICLLFLLPFLPCWGNNGGLNCTPDTINMSKISGKEELALIDSLNQGYIKEAGDNWKPEDGVRKEKSPLSKKELRVIEEKADAVRKDFPGFEKKYAEMVEAFGWTFSSHVETVKVLPQYAELKSMGTGIIPLLVEKMATASNGFYARPLYNELQPMEKLRCSKDVASSG